MSSIMINQLPVRTWNRLHMNESGIEMVPLSESITPVLKKIDNNILWNPETTESEETDMETGMGKELDSLISSVPAAELRSGIGNKASEAVVLEYGYHPGDCAANRLNLYGEKNSELSVIILLRSEGKGEGVSALQTRIIAEEGARIRLFVVQLLDEGFICLNDIGAVCGDRASVELVKLELGAGRLYAGAAAQLKGAESSFKADVGYYGRSSQHLDMNYVVRHSGKKTSCEMNVYGALEDGAFKLFRGTIDFLHGAAGAKGNEQEDVLLLGKNVINQTIPLILCQEEDVEGNHGATIGRLDEKMLFYLSSRGIPEEAARQLIVQSRIHTLCDQIPEESIRARVYEWEDGQSKEAADEE